MKLETKHITPYFPYNLYFIRYEKKCLDKSVTPVIWSKDLHPFKTQLNPVSLNGFDYEKSKPILRPLSDLTKEIENYNLDLSIREVNKLENLIKTNDTQQYQNLEYSTILFLCANHYDFQNLIPKGLAIDINALEK